MKIRIKGNSIRLRLTKSEVFFFGEQGLIEEHTVFGNSKLTYRLASSSTHHELSSTYLENVITIYIPKSVANEWTTTDLIGIDNKLSTGNQKELFLMVEKDFVCLDNTFEDQSDQYPNPNSIC